MRAGIRILLLMVGLTAVASAEPQPPSYRVIVHPNNPVSSVSRDFLADVFLKKKTRWGNNDLIRPVDLAPRSSVRGRFCSQVLRRSVSAVRSYWRQIVFSGRGVPPPELASDEAIVSYVLRHRGAIGYVSSAADLSSVKIVVVR
jgi:ABC-type phosphate transport system substrate-binding protein